MLVGSARPGRGWLGQSQAANHDGGVVEGIGPLSHTHSPGTELFDQALSLVSAGLHERAGELLAECVRLDPAGIEAVDALLNNLKHRSGSPSDGEVRQLDADLHVARQEQRWDEIFSLALRRLTVASPSASALLALAEVSAARRHPELEARYVAAAAELAPDDVEVLRRRALLAARVGQFDAAIALWQQVERQDPSDLQSAKLIARLTIDRSLVEEVKPSELSLMPNGLLDQLSEQQMKELFAYLMSPTDPQRAAIGASE